MEKQKYSKPWLARFRWYRNYQGGRWYKYQYNTSGIEGWYWTTTKVKDYQGQYATLTLMKVERYDSGRTYNIFTKHS